MMTFKQLDQTLFQ